jgi:predicted phosphate transport protein (TIGR00153 family)
MKTTNPLASLFGKSPFGPIQKHMRIVEQCAQELPPLFEALRADDTEQLQARKEEIFRLEHEADELKNTIRSSLPTTFLMPVGRRDLLDLLSTQDSIAGAAQDVASIVALGKLKVPPAMDALVFPFVDRVVDAVSTSRSAVDALDELVETGFRGREAETVLTIAREIDEIESETDTMGMDLVRVLVDHEAEMGVLSVVFWYQLIRSIGNVADEAENVGDRLRLLLAR